MLTEENRQLLKEKLKGADIEKVATKANCSKDYVRKVLKNQRKSKVVDMAAVEVFEALEKVQKKERIKADKLNKKVLKITKV